MIERERILIFEAIRGAKCWVTIWVMNASKSLKKSLKVQQTAGAHRGDFLL